MIWLVDENKTMKNVKNITKHLKEYTQSGKIKHAQVKPSIIC